jgi:hypothetical protein
MGCKGANVIEADNNKQICPLLSNENQITYNNEKLFINFDVLFGEWYRYRSQMKIF